MRLFHGSPGARLRRAGIAATVLIGTLMLAPGASASVSNVMVSQGISSATSARASYTVGFTATGGMAAGDTVTINFPTGTGLNSQQSSSIVDVTNSNTQVGTCSNSATTTVNCSTTAAVTSGDTVSVMINGVINPASAVAGNTVSVSTTADPGAVQSSNTYAVTLANSVSNVTVSQGISSATSARASYTVGFKTSGTGGMATGQADTVTITFPTGTGVNSQTSSSIVDVTNSNTQVGTCNNSATATVTCSVFFTNAAVSAGDVLSVVINGVINPASAAAGNTVSVSTTSDNASPVASSNTYAVTTANSVSNVTVSQGISSATSARASYTVGFKTSGTGGMATGQADTVTITFPTGTGLNSQQSSSIVDVTNSNTQVGTCNNSATATVTCSVFFTNAAVSAGDVLSVVINGVINPASAAAGNTVSVSTTSDNASPVASSITYAVTTANSVSNVTVSQGISSATSARASYTVGFKTSGTGGMATGQADTVTITFPTGTGLNSQQSSSIVDVTNSNTQVGTCNNSATATVTCSVFFTNAAVSAGDVLSVVINGVINPASAAAGNTVSVSTTSDNASPVASSITYAVTTANSVSNVTVSQGISSATSARASYTVGFKTSGTGGMATGQADTVTITFPTGTGLNSQQSSSIVDVTNSNTQVGTCNNSATATVTCSVFFTNAAVSAGDVLSVVINGVINPASAAAGNTVSVSTTSDNASPVASSNTYAVTTANSVSAVQASVSSTSPGATGVTYTVGFATSGTGGMATGQADTVTITFPTGTGLNSQTSSSITDTTTNTQVGTCNNSATATVTCSVFFTNAAVSAGDVLSVVINGVANPSVTSNTDTLSVETTSDNASAVQSNAYFAAPTVTRVSPSSGPAGGGTSVTITGTNLAGASAVSFGTTAASSFTVDTATQITATSPAGSGTVDVTVTTPAGTSEVSASDQFTYQAPPPPPPSPPTVTGINPPTGPAVGGTSVAITGTNFTGATAVSFGNAAATFTVNSATQITATSPPGSGTVDVTVTTPGGTSATGPADQFAYVALAPVVFTPTAAVPSSSTATFSGSVNPLGLATTAFFQYGLDSRYTTPGTSGPTYTNSTSVQQVGSDSSPHVVSTPVSGLVPNALYHVRLVATNSAGTTFGPDQTFMTPAAPAPPPPVLGRTLDAAVVSGLVQIKLPGGGFVPLTQARALPTGTEVDARLGTINLISATGQGKKTQTGAFGGAVFRLTQQRAGASKGLATLSLLEAAFPGAPTYASCKAKATDTTEPSAHTAKLSSKVLQTLRASGHGKFRTSGRYGAATVLGTIWTITDQCNGTQIHAIKDTVSVQDLVLHKTIILHAGHTYLAKAPTKKHK